MSKPSKVLACGVAALVVFACSARAMGQQVSLALGSGAATSGGSATLNLTLATTGGVQPTAAEWVVGYPAAAISGVAVSLGATANAAGKKLDCLAIGANQTKCLLYGLDRTGLPDGVAATVLVQVKAGTPTSVVPITLTATGATNAAGDTLLATGQDGSVAVTAASASLQGITCNPSLAVMGPSRSTCTVSLSGAAPSAIVIALASKDRTITVPITVTIPLGATSAQAVVSVHSVTSIHNVVLTATANGVVVSTTVQVIPLGLAVQTLSGNVGVLPSGSAISVTTTSLAGKAIAVTPDATGNFVVPGLVSGTYTVTPASVGSVFAPINRSVTIAKANVAGVNFTPQVAVPGALMADVQFSTDQNSANSTVKTPVFSTRAPQELLLAFIATDSTSSPNTMVTDVTGAGLTWTLVVRTNQSAGTAEIWKAFAPTVLNSVSVVATLSQSVASSITVRTFGGVNASNPIGAVGSGNGTSGAPAASLVTTKSGSMVVGVGNDFDNAVARTPGQGQQILHQFLTAAGDTYWVQALASPVPTAGTQIVLTDTAPTTDQYNLSICEVLSAGGK